jgi:hypothetical protein
MGIHLNNRREKDNRGRWEKPVTSGPDKDVPGNSQKRIRFIARNQLFLPGGLPGIFQITRSSSVKSVTPNA